MNATNRSMDSIPCLEWAESVVAIAKHVVVEFETDEVDEVASAKLREVFNTLQDVLRDHHLAATLKRWQKALVVQK